MTDDAPRQRKPTPRPHQFRTAGRKLPPLVSDAIVASDTRQRKRPPRWSYFPIAVDDDGRLLNIAPEVIAFFRESQREGISRKAARKAVTGMYGYFALTPTQRGVWTYILAGLNAHWRCTWPSARTIADHCDYAFNSVLSAIRRFEEIGYLHVKGKARGKRFLFPTRKACPNAHRYWDWKGVGEWYIPAKYLPREPVPKKARTKRAPRDGTPRKQRPSAEANETRFRSYLSGLVDRGEGKADESAN